MEEIIRESCESKEDNLNKIEQLINKQYTNEDNIEDINENNEESILSESIGNFLNKFKEFIDMQFVNYINL